MKHCIKALFYTFFIRREIQIQRQNRIAHAPLYHWVRDQGNMIGIIVISLSWVAKIHGNLTLVWMCLAKIKDLTAHAHDLILGPQFSFNTG